jgi:hypothetical protein
MVMRALLLVALGSCTGGDELDAAAGLAADTLVSGDTAYMQQGTTPRNDSTRSPDSVALIDQLVVLSGDASIVLQSDDRVPLEYAQVSLEAGGLQFATLANREGRFVFPGVPPAIYQISVSDPRDTAPAYRGLITIRHPDSLVGVQISVPRAALDRLGDGVATP